MNDLKKFANENIRNAGLSDALDCYDDLNDFITIFEEKSYEIEDMSSEEVLKAKKELYENEIKKLQKALKLINNIENKRKILIKTYNKVGYEVKAENKLILMDEYYNLWDYILDNENELGRMDLPKIE